MPRFAANLTMMYTEVPFLDRFAAAARDGFDGASARRAAGVVDEDVDGTGGHECTDLSLQCRRIGDVDGETVVVLFSGQPLREPIVPYGPFVGNSRQDIAAYAVAFQSGAMGTLGEAHSVERFEFRHLVVRPGFTGRRRGVKVAFDGEVTRMRAPLDFRVLDQPLYLMKPGPVDTAPVAASEANR